MTQIEELMDKARDTLTVSRVYGEAYEKNGITVIPAAAVRGGGGAGEGEGAGEESGSGGGFGMMARPVGAFRIKGDDVTWVPAADTTRVIIMGQVVAIVALMAFRSVLRSRQRGRRSGSKA